MELNLPGSLISQSRFEKLIFSDKIKGDQLFTDYVDDLNYVLSRLGLSSQEAYYRYIKNEKDKKVHDQCKIRIIARIENWIVAFSRSCSKEFNYIVNVSPEYKVKFDTELDAQLFLIRNKIAIGDYYLHFKGGLYKFMSEAKDSETLEDLIVYKAMYGDGTTWVRPKSMFFEEVELNGVKVPRFKKL